MAQSQQAKKKKKCSRLLLHEAIVTIATAPDKLKKQSKSSHRTLSDHTPNGTKLINLSGYKYVSPLSAPPQQIYTIN